VGWRRDTEHHGPWSSGYVHGACQFPRFLLFVAPRVSNQQNLLPLLLVHIISEHNQPAVDALILFCDFVTVLSAPKYHVILQNLKSMALEVPSAREPYVRSVELQIDSVVDDAERSQAVKEALRKL